MKAYLRPYPVQCQQRRAFMLIKAVQHKYLSKHKKNGRWVYVYPKKGSGNRHSDTHQADRTRHVPGDDQIHAGSSFSAGSGKGHYQVESVTDGKVTFHLDDEGGKKGATQTMSLKDFKATVAGAHKDAHDRHATEGLKARQDILKRAELFGTEKQKARAKAEVERWQKKHFPEEKSPPSEGGSSAPHDIGAIKKHFKLWEKGSHRRAYLSAKALKEAGAEISYHKSGNLSSFKFNGEKLSNADGRRILHSGMYYDLNKGEWELGGMNKREFSHIAQSIIDTFSHKEEPKGGLDGPGKDRPTAKSKPVAEMSKDEYVSHRTQTLVRSLEEQNKQRQSAIDNAKDDTDRFLAGEYKRQIKEDEARIKELKSGLRDLVFADEYEQAREKHSPEKNQGDGGAGDHPFSRDIPLDLAKQAFEGTSRSPTRAAEAIIREYQGVMDEAKALAEKAGRDGPSFEGFRERYRDQTLAWLRSRDGATSWAVTGRSNRKSGGDLNREDKALRDLVDMKQQFFSEANRAIQKEGRPKRLSEEMSLDNLKKRLAVAEGAHKLRLQVNKIAQSKKLSEEGKLDKIKQIFGDKYNEDAAKKMIKPKWNGAPPFDKEDLAMSRSDIKSVKRRLDEVHPGWDQQ